MSGPKDTTDGGPAFPQTNEQRYSDPVHGVIRQSDINGPAEAGMSLRDYFAAKAMHAEIVTAGALEGPRDALVEAACAAGRDVEDQIAFNAYRLADAMLRERAK